MHSVRYACRVRAKAANFSDSTDYMVKEELNKEIIILLVLGLVLVLAFYLYGEINWRSEQYAKLDLHKYKAMAQAKWIADAKVPRPFCYRWLGPMIAGLMPFDAVKSFRILGWFFCGCFVYLFYIFLHSRGYSKATAFAVLLIVIFNKYLFGCLVWNYFQLADIITLVLLVSMFWTMQRRSWFWFGTFLAIGAATKEINMLMIPVAWLFVRGNGVSKDKVRLFWSCLVAVVVFVTVRYLTHPAGGTGLFRAFAAHSSKLLNLEKLAKMFINVWVPVSFIPIIFFRHTWVFFKKHSYLFLFALMIYFANLFGANTERLLAPAGIVVYWLLADIMENNLPQKKCLVLIVAASAGSCWHYEIGRFLLPSQQVTILLACIGLLVASAIAVYYRLMTQRQQE